ncbi:MAG TPA: hypothetical protein PKZ76_16840 [Xanthomonadaceae bacterium]|nr:hypothetical protein [Xanthomonadaceae bacterium]
MTEPITTMPWQRAAVARELLAHAGLLGLIWYSGTGFAGLMLMLLMQSAFAALLYVALPGERGVLGRMGRSLILVLLSAFVVLMVSVWYDDIVGGRHGDLGPVERWFETGSTMLRWAGLWVTLHLGVLALSCWTWPRPRPRFFPLAAIQADINLGQAIALLAFMVLCLILQAARVNPLELLGVFLPFLSLEDCLVLVTVGLRLFMGLLCSRMGEARSTDVGGV